MALFGNKKKTQPARKALFVATDGNDQNQGTLEAPFATLDTAIAMARMSIDPTTVFIRGGRYFINSTVELNEKDNGLIISAYEDESVILDAGVVIDPSDLSLIPDTEKGRIVDVNAREKILRINLKPYRIQKGILGTRGFRRAYQNGPNELYIDGKPYSITAYPKRDAEPILLTEKDIIDAGSKPYDGDFSLRPAKIRIPLDKAKAWKKADEAYISGYFGSTYADDTIKLKEINSTEATVTTTLPHIYSFRGTDGCHYRILNLLEEISRPGEYYVDTQNDFLYFYPEKDVSMSLIQVSSLDRVMMSVENATCVTIKGLTFENGRNSGLYIEGGSGVTVDGCTFRNLGVMGIQIGCGATPMPEGKHNAHGMRAPDVAVPVNLSRNMGNWHEHIYEFAAWNNNGGEKHRIINCSIYDTGAGGMLLSGGDRKSLTPANNTVYNCYFTRNNRLNRTYAGAINLMGVGNKISHCEIEQLPSVAIYLHGNDHEISYNRIHDVVKEVSDMGAIYMGRDCTEVGNVIHNNFIYDIKSSYTKGYGISALYFDDNAIYNAAYSNIIYNVKTVGTYNFDVIHFNKGGMTSISNNYFIDCNCNPTPSIPNNGYDVMRGANPLITKRAVTKDPMDFSGVDLTSSVWKKRYPYLYASYKHNYNAGMLFYNNEYINGVRYHMFENAKKKNFKIIDSEAQKIRTRKSDAYINDPVMGYKNEKVPHTVPDFENMGLIKK